MDHSFQIDSADPQLLEKAAGVAKNITRNLMVDGVVGIVLLGAIPRGYFDRHADVDIAVLKTPQAEIPYRDKFFRVDEVEVHLWLSDFEDELERSWDMSKRWTYSQGEIRFDPEGNTARLLEEKVPLRPEERRWLIRSGFTRSEWYINRLTQLWVERGSMISAHHMFAQGLHYFFDMLFGLNDQLIPDMKWRYYCVERLDRLPSGFSYRVQEAMSLRAFTEEELKRRRDTFMEMWGEFKPIIEEEMQLSFEEMVNID